MNESYLPHRFNPQVAEVYGINAALIFQYVCFRSQLVPTRWVDPTLEDICKQYPYLGEWQVWAALKKLINSGKKTPALLCRKQVKGTYLYRPIANDVDSYALHSFDVRIALKVGVVPAIIYHNVGHWIRENWKQRAQFWYERLNPAEFDDDDYQMQRFAYQMTRGAAAHYTTAVDWLATHRYVKLSSAKCGFMRLQQAGLLRKGLRKRHKQFWHLTRKSLNDFEQEMLSKSDLGNSSSKTQSQRQKPKTKARNPKSTPETQPESRLSASGAGASNAFEEADFIEAELRFNQPVGDNCDAIRPLHTLAGARGGSAGTASDSASPPPAVSGKELRRMNCPNQPWVKKKINRDAFGHVVKRHYLRKPKPDDLDYDEYIDNLSTEERRAYEASFRS